MSYLTKYREGNVRGGSKYWVENIVGYVQRRGGGMSWTPTNTYTYLPGKWAHWDSSNHQSHRQLISQANYFQRFVQYMRLTV